MTRVGAAKKKATRKPTDAELAKRAERKEDLRRQHVAERLAELYEDALLLPDWYAWKPAVADTALALARALRRGSKGAWGAIRTGATKAMGHPEMAHREPPIVLGGVVIPWAAPKAEDEHVKEVLRLTDQLLRYGCGVTEIAQRLSRALRDGPLKARFRSGWRWTRESFIDGDAERIRDALAGAHRGKFHLDDKQRLISEGGGRVTDAVAVTRIAMRAVGMSSEFVKSKKLRRLKP